LRIRRSVKAIGKGVALACLIFLTVSSATGSGEAAQQFRCDAPTANEWLALPADRSMSKTVEEADIHRIEGDLEGAIGLLDKSSAVRLTKSQLAGFGVERARALGQRRRAYLVRAVYPTANPRLSIGWNGDDLHVFADGLGCAPFVKHPVIVILDREPERIFVAASAAL